MAKKYTVVITKSIQKQLSRLPDDTANQLEAHMLQLEDNPRPLGCKKLKGRKGYRIRVGNYRIIYEIQDNVLLVIILKAGDRKDIYK